jgi:hypothetical protein
VNKIIFEHVQYIALLALVKPRARAGVSLISGLSFSPPDSDGADAGLKPG